MGKQPESSARPYFWLAGIAIIEAIIDQASKFWIVKTVPPGHAISVIPGFFDIVSVRNRGAAFGFLNSPDIQWQFWLFMAATVAAVWAICVLARQARRQPLMIVGLGLILGGALGNLIDRLRYRSVVDFLDFYCHGWHWPAFNIADAGICAGVFLACVAMWRKQPGKKT